MTKSDMYIKMIDANVKDIMNSYDKIINIGREVVNDIDMGFNETGTVLDRIRLLEITDFARDLREKVYC